MLEIIIYGFVKNKDVYTCGDNRYGQLGLQHSNNVNVLTKIDIQESIFYGLFEFKYNKDFYEIYIGFNSSFFKDNNGFLFACGKNDYGQLGLDNSNEVIYPTIITFNFNKKNIIVGDDFTYFHEFFTGYNSTLANQDIQREIMILIILINIFILIIGYMYVGK